MYNAISFFSGAGGLDLGLEKAGFDIKLSVEIEEVYCETMKNNNPGWNVFKGDIMTFDTKKIYSKANLDEDEEIDLVVGGSPCQSFSTAGKRTAFSDSRGQAMLRFAEVVSDIKPKAFILENVRGLLSSAIEHRPLNKRGEGFPPLKPSEERGSALKYLFSQFDGYKIEKKLLNAADFGVPQKRQRVFIVGIREDLDKSFKFPEPTHSEHPVEDKKPWVPVSEVLKPLKRITHQHTNYSEERLKYMKMIPKGGGNWRDLRRFGEDVVKEAMGGAYNSGGGKVGFYRRIKSNEPAPTILTSPVQKSTNLGHPYEDRPLSVQEYLAIQQFPVNYKVSGTLHQQYIQIGNAVPVGLAECIGKSLISILKEASEKIEVGV